MTMYFYTSPSFLPSLILCITKIMLFCCSSLTTADFLQLTKVKVLSKGPAFLQKARLFIHVMF